MEDVLVEEPVLTPIKNGRYNSTSFMKESCLNKFPQFEKLIMPLFYKISQNRPIRDLSPTLKNENITSILLLYQG